MGKHDFNLSAAAQPEAHAARPRKPAVEALVILFLAHALTLLITAGLSSLAGWRIGAAPAVLLQGAIAAGLTARRGHAVWWVLIQALFPGALLTLSFLQLPSWIFFAVFLLLLVLYWSTFRTQVPYYPSTRAAWDAVHGLLPQGRPLRVIDIGSGMGGLVLDGARRRPESRFLGIEIAPLPFLISWLRNFAAGRRGQFLMGDYQALDFSQFDAVFAYLSPAAMPALWHKASAEMRAGSTLMSYEFVVPDVAPHQRLQPRPGGPFLYVWKF